MVDINDVERFAKLFRGNDRTFGKFYPNGKDYGTHKIKVRGMETLHRPPTLQDFQDHVEGIEGMGVVPIMDDGYCWFGALDLDAHGDAPDLDLVEIERTVRELDLPLTVCRSKSGGIHLYLFGAEPLKASTVRTILAKWAQQIGFGGCEVFPKQEHLIVDRDGSVQNGNWINLGNFDVENPDALRYCVEGGKRVSFGYFLDLAEARRVTGSMLVEKGDDQHAEAPPCIQKMIANGVPSGHRNEALYNIVIYLKQSHPETYRDKAFDLNSRIFDQPLAHAEAKKTITSASRRDYRYKCKEEPCRSSCNSSVCVTRKFGITPDEKGEMEMGKPPEFGVLEKHLTNPVRWRLFVDNVGVYLTTTQLMDYRAIREAVADALTRLIPPMKNDRWQAQLHQLMQSAVVVEAPEEASATGLVHSQLESFIQKADLKSDGKTKEDRQGLLNGVPVVQVDPNNEKERIVYFRGQDFVQHLKKVRFEELKGANLWIAMRDMGVGHSVIRVNKSAVKVWFLHLTEDNVIDYKRLSIKSEF